jgi:hypothetical protein
MAECKWLSSHSDDSGDGIGGRAICIEQPALDGFAQPNLQIVPKVA